MNQREDLMAVIICIPVSLRGSYRPTLCEYTAVGDASITLVRHHAVCVGAMDCVQSI